MTEAFLPGGNVNAVRRIDEDWTIQHRAELLG